MKKKYKATYDGYVHSKPKVDWSSEEDMKKSLTYVDLESKSPIEKGGIPIISDGQHTYIDTSDNHVMIYGQSGSKKSLCVFMELIDTVALSGETFIALDVKGELYARTGRFVKSNGYNVIVLNFRDFDGEGYNPLSYPAQLYRKGETDKGAALAAEFIALLASKQEESSKSDPFWPATAKSYESGVIPLMFDSYTDIDSINLMSLSDFNTSKTANILYEYINQEKITNSALQNIKLVLSEPDKTLMSTLSTCSSFIQPFVQNEKLTRMLSHSTFRMEDLLKPKTAVYIIADDNNSLCYPIIGAFISQLQSLFNDKAFHSKNNKLETRVNFILDEFCSIPLPNMELALATHRSRNIRYYLCVQSLDLLSKQYTNYKNMMTNCATTLFLGSTEMELLEDISRRCGTTEITSSGHEEPLISVQELMTLRQSWYDKETVYLNLTAGIRYCTVLPAIEKYEMFRSDETSKLPSVEHPPYKFYSFEHLMVDISEGKTHKPFHKPQQISRSAEASKRRVKRKTSSEDKYVLDADIQKELERKFDELFGALDDND